MDKTKTNHHNKIEELEQENEALKDLLDASKIMLSHATSKKVSQSFEIIDLKNKISDYKIDIFVLVLAVIFISILAILK